MSGRCQGFREFSGFELPFRTKTTYHELNAIFELVDAHSLVPRTLKTLLFLASKMPY